MEEEGLEAARVHDPRASESARERPDGGSEFMDRAQVTELALRHYVDHCADRIRDINHRIDACRGAGARMSKALAILTADLQVWQQRAEAIAGVVSGKEETRRIVRGAFKDAKGWL